MGRGCGCSATPGAGWGDGDLHASVLDTLYGGKSGIREGMIGNAKEQLENR